MQARHHRHHTSASSQSSLLCLFQLSYYPQPHCTKKFHNKTSRNLFCAAPPPHPSLTTSFWSLQFGCTCTAGPAGSTGRVAASAAPLLLAASAAPIDRRDSRFAWQTWNSGFAQCNPRFAQIPGLRGTSVLVWIVHGQKGAKAASKILVYLVAIKIPVNIIIDIAPRDEIPPQTWTDSGCCCLAAYTRWWPFLYVTLRWGSICIVLSSDQ